MDIYHVWCDLQPGVSDMDFSHKTTAWLGHLRNAGLIEGWRLTRRKLGLSPPGMGDFHIMIEVKNLAQLEDAFQRAASRQEPAEGFHFGVNSLVRNSVFALYRDFPDAMRHVGEEKF
jgi:hypothetical protein